MRGVAVVAPNSPRDSGVGVVMPRAMKPDWVSKSKVRQTIWRGIAASIVDCPAARAMTKIAMATHTIGIIVNGATGRIGGTQHLANALAPIRDEGGLPAGNDRIVPRLMLAGRDAARVEAAAKKHNAAWTTDLDKALADPDYTVFFDAAATHQREAVLERAIAAGKHIYSEKPVALSVERGRGAAARRAGPRRQARRGRGQARPARTCRSSRMS